MTSGTHTTSTNLTIPATQNTAPVLSFNCLYTHDLRRKAKRWQDGVLRFHTFNKRVMVYDVPRNFVGDTHWRESNTLQDGDELELEKGVLIQVGEEVERTETDLTELLEKRKPKPAPAANDENVQHPPPTIQAAGTSHRGFEQPRAVQSSALRPKTLNTLLGTPRGRVGRAAISTKSPADLRQDRESNSSIEERSPKRRRVEYPTGPQVRATPATLGSLHPTPEPAGRRKPSVDATTLPQGFAENRSSNNREKLLHSVRPVADIPRRDNGSKRRNGQEDQANSGKSKSPPNDHEDTRTIPSKQSMNTSLSTVPEMPQRPPVGQAVNRSTVRQKMPTQRPTPNPVDPKPRKEIINIDATSDRASLNTDSRSQNLLRIATTKPRKKLMYRDLLPQKAPPHQISLRSNEEYGATSSVASHATKHTNASYRLDDFHEAQQDRLLSRLNRCRPSTEDVPAQKDGLVQEPCSDVGEVSKDSVQQSNNNIPSNTNDDYAINDSLFLTQSSVEELSRIIPNPISKQTEPH
ncbi:MAG: hypothetical protein Q9174_002931, partial [Haloplaca sp. 1 TL-2023]